MSQLTLFDAAEPMNAPRFKEGDDIYQVLLDVIRHYRVSGTFTTGVDVFGSHGEPGRTLWRYHLDGVDVSAHNVFGECEIEGRWFSDLDMAQAQASRSRALIEDAGMVTRADAIKPVESVAFSIGDQHSQKPKSQAARLGSYSVLEQQAYCYPFIKVFNTTGEADRFYRSLVKELEAKGGITGAVQCLRHVPGKRGTLVKL